MSFKRSGFRPSVPNGGAISLRDEVQRLRHAPTSSRGRVRLWVLIAGASLVAGAYWLRAPGLRYLLVSTAAMAAAALLAVVLPRRARAWALIATAVGLLFCAVAGMWQRQLWRIERDWAAHRAELVARAGQRLDERLDDARRQLRATATRALDAPSTPAEAFPFLETSGNPGVEGGVVLYRAGRPFAWAGRVMARTDSLYSPLGTTYSPFYVTVHAVATRGQDRAVATALVHAEPPADRLAQALDESVLRATGLRAFEFLASDPSAHAAAAPPLYVYRAGTDTLLHAALVAPGPEQARLYALERARAVGALLLGIALMLLIATAWRHEPRLWWRLLPLGIALVCVALVPLNAFSNATILFDPTVYFAEHGGAFTASAGALALASALILLAILLVLRARARLVSRWGAALFALATMIAGPFLLRALARGVAPPPGGVTTGLWLAWQLALFLASVSLLLAATAAGAAALGRFRGLPLLVAPALAAATALLGPAVVLPAGRWPEWYVVLWIAVIGALAFTRPHRGMVVTAAIVAALGATLLTWNAGLRGRIALAERDLSALTVEEPEIGAALRRLGDSLARGEPPRGEAGLLRAYLRSDLSGAGYPVRLTRWSAEGERSAEVSLAQVEPPASEVLETVREAMRSGAPVLRTLNALPGAFGVLAVPHETAGATSVVVAPRTRLIPDEPFVSLMGVEARERGEAPYVVTLVDDVDAARAGGDAGTRWQQEGSELHGDRTIITANGPRRAHIELDLRSTGAMVQRGVLVVFLDLLVMMALWLVSTLPEGALARWTRGRVQRWRRSYRARLTLALFAFFVVPALVFAAWSYRRLQTEDRQSRELLLRETLRAAAGVDEGGSEWLAAVAAAGETPLFLYRNGELQQTSDPLFAELAPAGRFLPFHVYEGLERDREVFASAQVDVGDGTALFGYRVLGGPAGEQLILAAPARGNEEALDQRRRDLGVLVLFSTLLGALAALWLSGIAARSLAEPIGRMRTAALAIAGGEREPPLDRRPPVEFEPVFAAFRRMANDLGESRAALESAQRRTAAVLRNVA
ncbi:MAG: HAMP domain-containing protein, partial [Gemmatimonadaceae bacterium]